MYVLLENLIVQSLYYLGIDQLHALLSRIERSPYRQFCSLSVVVPKNIVSNSYQYPPVERATCTL
jgi:hypothetical protein